MICNILGLGSYPFLRHHDLELIFFMSCLVNDDVHGLSCQNITCIPSTFSVVFSHTDCELQTAKNFFWSLRIALRILALRFLVATNNVRASCALNFLFDLHIYLNCPRRMSRVPCDDGNLGSWLETGGDGLSGSWLVWIRDRRNARRLRVRPPFIVVWHSCQTRHPLFGSTLANSCCLAFMSDEATGV